MLFESVPSASMLKMQLILLQCVLLPLAYGALEFEPKPDSGSSLIAYKSGDESTSQHLRNRIHKFLAPYTATPSDKSLFVKCPDGVAPKEGSNQVCDANVNQWLRFVPEDCYKYNSESKGTCVFLKLAKEPQWIPEYYNSSTVPADMPYFLKSRIQEYEETYRIEANKLNFVWLYCEGETPDDKKRIGSTNYYPHIGFDGQHFPVRNENQYLSPLVVVQFLRVERGISINVRCQAWARNLIDEVVRFELVVE